MEEKLDRLEKHMDDLIEIVVAIKDNMVTKEEFAQLAQKVENLDAKIDDVEERLASKIDGLQRSIDGAYERQSALETRISKVEERV